jgi:hypothetical protein
VSRSPAWILRCKVCKAQYGPYSVQERVNQLLDGASQLDCGHMGADVVSQSL